MNSRPAKIARRAFREPASVASAMIAAGLALNSFFVTPALAAAPPGHDGKQTIFLIQFTLLLLVGRLFGEAAQRLGQPAVIGQLLAGIVLGPSVVGLLWPEAEAALFPHNPEQKNMIDAVSQLGVLMLLFLTGMETDLKLIRKIGRAAFSVSISGILIPFACGFALGEGLPESMLPRADLRLVTSLFFGAALSISSVKIVAMVVRDMDFMRRDLGQIIIASAIIDDTIGWIIIAVIFALGQGGSINSASLAWSVAGVTIFLAGSLWFGGRLVSVLIRFVNDNFVSETPVITAILLVMTIMALITQTIGVNTVLGAFVAGVLVGQSPILTRRIDEQLRGMIVALFMPVFFGLAGLEADLSIFTDAGVAALATGFVLIATLGKFLGAGLGGVLGGLSRRQSIAVAFAMNARGSTEVIVATIGLAMGALDHKLFTMIVAMAIVTTMIMPPSLRWALARVPLGAEEKARLEREAVEAKSFTANLDRFLVAVDNGPSGRLASRLAGLLAGTRQKPVTVLGPAAGNMREDLTAAGVTKEAAQRAEVATSEAGNAALTTSVEARARQDSADKAVAAEGGKGYDLLLIGLENATNLEGEFSTQASRTAEAFEGALAVSLARGVHSEDPANGPLRLLVPINGNPASHRAAETAVVLARVGGVGSVTGIYASGETAGKPGRPSWRQRLSGDEEAILTEFVAMAERYGISVNTLVRQNANIQEMVIDEAAKGDYTLLVLGVSRRNGDNLFFGNVAKALTRRCPISILLVST
jgi:Kef-type K+ transport system membrane component KefB/nucleotide-binding universal stress UspA family protein